MGTETDGETPTAPEPEIEAPKKTIAGMPKIKLYRHPVFRLFHFIGGLFLGLCSGLVAITLFVLGLFTFPWGIIAWVVAIVFVVLALGYFKAALKGPTELENIGF